MSLHGPLTIGTVAEMMQRFGTPEQVRANRFRIRTVPDQIRDAVQAAEKHLGCDHLITISAADTGTLLELQYHLTGLHRTIVSFALRLPRERPEAPSIADLIPPAGLYERQIHDLLGILFPGHPSLKRIILYEDWPENEYPLRKDWKPHPDSCPGTPQTEES